MNTADVLTSIAVTFAKGTFHIDDVNIFFTLYVENNFPTHRHSKEWALNILQITYEKHINEYNQYKGQINVKTNIG